MSINRKNFEQYFLLFADNELDKTEQQKVLAFVRKNPDLQNQFDELIATIQKPDKISMPDKSLLLKQAGDWIDIDNYEERFVEYHDGELSDDEQQRVLIFLNGHKALKDQFDLLAAAKMRPGENIIFPNKRSLLKKRYVTAHISFVRYGIAASLAGLFIWLGVDRFGNKLIIKSDRETVVNTQTSPSPGTKEKDAAHHDHFSGLESGRGEIVAKQYPQNLLPDKTTIILPDSTSEEDLPKKRDIAKVEKSKTVAVALSGTENNHQHGDDALSKTATGVVANNSLSIIGNGLPGFDTLSEAFTDHANTPPTFEVRPREQDDRFSADDIVVLGIPTSKIKNSRVGALLSHAKKILEDGNPLNRFLNKN